MRQRPFAGRQKELDGIQSCLTDSDVTGVVIVGDAGTGRTRLAREALDLFSADDREVAWVAATHALRSIPFGAVAHLLPPDWRPDGDRLSVLSLIAKQVRERGGFRPMLIGVDDAHLLDAGSAAVLSHLANQRLAFLLITVRNGARCPDAVTALWKDGPARRIELAPLPDDGGGLSPDHSPAGQPEGCGLQVLHRAAATDRSVRPGAVAGNRRPAAARPRLSPREHSVFVAYASGLTLQSAARRVGVSPATARTYLERVKMKYQQLGRPAQTKLQLAMRLSEDYPNEIGKR
ncbi:AAA family ATPase [Spirillospora sp. NPDC047279]|uniref:AAA family ATPase n=1 Tax=Spirillospora sp. NPDC047279 TaxID=3155478 RepID=UPI00340FF9C2